MSTLGMLSLFGYVRDEADDAIAEMFAMLGMS